MRYGAREIEWCYYIASKVYCTSHRATRSPARNFDLMKDNLSAPSVTMTVGKIDDEVASAGSVAD